MTQKDIRKLITIRKIENIVPIEGADAIETAVLGGWRVVIAKRDGFKVGDHVVYLEIDSFLPEGHPAWQFLVEKSARNAVSPDGKDVRGHVLRTVKLRGQVSQGLILRAEDFGLNENSTQEEINETFAALGVFKWEPALPVGSADTVGAFPSFIKKTDSERVQNIGDEFLASLDPTEWIAEEKIDGTSSTFWKIDGVLHAAGRNWELSLEGEGTHAQIARQYNLSEVLPEGSFIQGEIYGEGIQKNPLKIQGRRLAVFSSGRITYGPAVAWTEEETAVFDKFCTENSAPIVNLTFPRTVDEAIQQVDGLKSLVNPQAQAEGVVWWNIKGRLFSETGDRGNFKAINNVFLAKLKD